MCAWADISDTEIVTEGGDVSTSQSHSRQKKRYMTNISLTDSDEEAIVDSVKDYKELYDKTSAVLVWSGSKRNCWEAELDSG